MKLLKDSRTRSIEMQLCLGGGQPKHNVKDKMRSELKTWVNLSDEKLDRR